MGTSVAEGEVPINVIEQAFDTDSITYYPLTPESPEDKHDSFAQCQDFSPVSFLPPGMPAGVPFSTQFMPHVLSKPPTTTKGETIVKLTSVCLHSY